MGKRYIVTGIHTDVGKTVVSAILAEALEATYWKPVQAGDLENSDSIRVKNLTSNVTIKSEAFQLNSAMSPHAAAKIDGKSINISDLKYPDVEGNLIIEGAGGVMVPLNDEGLTILDAITYWNLPTVVVSKNYLGSINHTLLTTEALKSRNIEIKGIIFVGDENIESQDIILKCTNLPMIGLIPLTELMDKKFISEQASKIKSKL